MRGLLTILLLTLFPMHHYAQSVSLEQARMVFEKVKDNEKLGSKFLRETKIDSELNPITRGYKGAIMMVMAKHLFNPYNKWKSFGDGKKLLEQSILSEPENLELIYLRFCIQTNAPGFLGYNANIPNDRRLLKDNVEQIKDKSLKVKIITYLTLVENKNLFPHLMLSTNP